MKRQIRREHRQRKLAEAKVLLLKFGFDPAHASWWADNLKKCSCSMCCNPRRNGHLKGREKLTLQEQRANDNYQSQLSDLQENTK